MKLRINTMRTIVCIVAMSLIGLLFSSCSNENAESVQNGDEDILRDGIELTFKVGEQTTDSAFTRAAMQPITEHQTFMGMDVETSIVDDSKVSHTRSTTVYNTVDLNGKKVYAALFDPATNKAVASLQTTEVKDNKITVKGKSNYKLLFYIGTRPSIYRGVDLTTVRVSEDANKDPMMCISDVIQDSNTPLGTLTFSHVFTKIRVMLKTSNGAIVNAFKVQTKEKLYTQASVNILTGNYSTFGTPNLFAFQVAGNTTPSAVAGYQTFVANPPASPLDLTLVFGTSGTGATIDGVQNYLTSANNTLVLKSRTLLPGHRYSINITVKPSNSDNFLNSGYRADRQLYQWDAYAPVRTGSESLWSVGNSGMRPPTTGGLNQNIASQSCKDCPTLDEVKMYLAAGTYADNGFTGPNQQSYTISNPDKGTKITYHTGLWLKRKQYIAGFDTGTAPKQGYNYTKGRPSQAEISQYFFLPMAGFYDTTNYANTHIAYQYEGTGGYYHMKTSPTKGWSNSSAFIQVLIFNINSAATQTLNWIPNNNVGCAIWSVD